MILTALKKRGHSSGALSIHPYFGKVDPALVGALLYKFSKQNETVLDPFCGSGTVIHEAILLNRNCIGRDSSPLAILIATSKLLGITESEEQQLLKVKENFHNLVNNVVIRIPDSGIFPTIPRILNLDKWFNKNAIKELKYIKWWIEENQHSFSDVIKTLIKLSFSRIITRSSNQQGESNYRSIDKPNIPGRVINLFTNSILDTIKYCKAYNRKKTNSDYLCERTFILNKHQTALSYSNEQSILLENLDSRNSPIINATANMADMVITSPPYLMSWDYGLYHKFRFYLLGFDLDIYEETEIGRHLRRKNDDIIRYTSDMKEVFSMLDISLKSTGTICMINSPSSVHGKPVNTNQILSECANAAGWKTKEIISSIELTGPHHGMHASSNSRRALVTGQAGKKEHVLIFEKSP